MALFMQFYSNVMEQIQEKSAGAKQKQQLSGLNTKNVLTKTL